MKQALITGFLLWALGTIALRLGGQHLLQPDQPGRTVLLYLAGFVLMAVLIPRICRGLKPERFQAAALLLLPTLILDPFSCAFFPRVFPNMDPGAAGVFGGWMLMCCAGGVAGVWMGKSSAKLKTEA